MNAVKSAIEQWEHSCKCYHEHNHFCVDIILNDMDVWATNNDDIWNALSSVAEEWGAAIDTVFNKCYLAIGLD